jgi:hypothetical protein
VLIGHADHEEVVGTLGEAPDSIRLVQRLDDVARPPVRRDRRRVSDPDDPVDRRDGRDGGVRCGSGSTPAGRSERRTTSVTPAQNRQDAVRSLARRCELILVVGSANSSNTTPARRGRPPRGLPGRACRGRRPGRPAVALRGRNLGDHGRRVGTRGAGATPGRGRVGPRPNRGRRIPDRRGVSPFLPPKAGALNANSHATEPPNRIPLDPQQGEEEQVLPLDRRDRAAVRLQPVVPGCGKIQHPTDILRKRLSVEDVVGAVEECGTPMVSIAGGEPLLHPDIAKIVDELIRRKIYVYLCTNAVLLRRRIDRFTPSRSSRGSSTSTGCGSATTLRSIAKGSSTRPSRRSGGQEPRASGSRPTRRSSTRTPRRPCVTCSTS